MSLLELTSASMLSRHEILGCIEFACQVLFLDAIEHVSRIARVIRLPLGNALLLGVGGSGRQSLTRLATYIEDFELFQIEIAKGYGKNEWRDDLKKVRKCYKPLLSVEHCLINNSARRCPRLTTRTAKELVHG